MRVFGWDDTPRIFAFIFCVNLKNQQPRIFCVKLWVICTKKLLLSQKSESSDKEKRRDLSLSRRSKRKGRAILLKIGQGCHKSWNAKVVLCYPLWFLNRTFDWLTNPLVSCYPVFWSKFSTKAPSLESRSGPILTQISKSWWLFNSLPRCDGVTFRSGPNRGSTQIWAYSDLDIKTWTAQSCVQGLWLLCVRHGWTDGLPPPLQDCLPSPLFEWCGPVFCRTAGSDWLWLLPSTGVARS